MSRRIDAHHHLWKVDRGDYHWMPDSGPLRQDYLPEDLAPLNEAAQIDGTILVQAAQTLAETEWLLEIASEPGSTILGVVGWIDLEAPYAPAQLERLAAHPKAVSVRPMLHDLADPAWITRPQVIQNLKHIPGLKLRFDILSFPVHIPYVLQAIDAVPDLEVVIDHLSKPEYGATPTEDWSRLMGELARRPQVFCKLSGMVTEVGEGWKQDDIRSHAEFILEAFGSNRVMVGTDWPVCLKVATHGEVITLAEALTAQLSQSQREQVWGETAAAFYQV